MADEFDDDAGDDDLPFPEALSEDAEDDDEEDDETSALDLIDHDDPEEGDEMFRNQD